MMQTNLQTFDLNESIQSSDLSIASAVQESNFDWVVIWVNSVSLASANSIELFCRTLMAAGREVIVKTCLMAIFT